MKQCKDCIYLSVTFDSEDKERFFCTFDDTEVQSPSQTACRELIEEKP